MSVGKALLPGMPRAKPSKSQRPRASSGAWIWKAKVQSTEPVVLFGERKRNFEAHSVTHAQPWGDLKVILNECTVVIIVETPARHLPVLVETLDLPQKETGERLA